MARSRNFAITYNLERYTLDKLYESIDLIDSNIANIKGYTIGAIETGEENGYKHTHVLVSFVNPIELDTIINLFLGLHVEVVRNYKQYHNYMKKDGAFIFDNLGLFSQDEEYCEDLINCVNFEEFLRLHPELIRSIDKYEKAFQYLNRFKD